MNRIVKDNNFSTDEYIGRNTDALRWARRYGTWGNIETVFIFDKNEQLISEAKYSAELKDYYRVCI